MDFSGITGQKEIIESLTHVLEQDKIGHAYIFNGPAGIGKRTIAHLFAGVLLCGERKITASCGVCQSCSMFEAGSNPDFYEIDTGAASISVDEIRDLQGDMAVRPFYGKRKVYLIADADKMTVQAQNCLLKTLEEPPVFAAMILTTSNYDALLETIRSRAVKYSFRKNTRDEVRTFLISKYGRGLKDVDCILSYSDGIIGKALELAGNDEFSSLREDTFKVILDIEQSDQSEVFRLSDFFVRHKDSIDPVFDIMASFYRDVLVSQKARKENLLINPDKKDIILNIAQSVTTRKLVRNIDIIGLTRLKIKKNVNFQLSIEVMLMKLRED